MVEMGPLQAVSEHCLLEITESLHHGTPAMEGLGPRDIAEEQDEQAGEAKEQQAGLVTGHAVSQG